MDFSSLADREYAAAGRGGGGYGGSRPPGAVHSSLAEVCGILGAELQVAGLVAREQFEHRRVRAGHAVIRAGAEFDALYVVNSGFVRLSTMDAEGNEQIVGFPLRGDLIGMDGMATGSYMADAVALTTCDIIIVPFARLKRVMGMDTVVVSVLYQAIGREIVREQAALRTIGTLTAEARVARFLLGLSARFGEMGFSRQRFMLRMTRGDIGSYLGLSLETVSRAISSIVADGALKVCGRAVDIVDQKKLEKIASRNSRHRCRGARGTAPQAD